MNRIQIDEGVEFGPNVIIYDHDHDFRAVGGLKASKYSLGEVKIGKNTWIGANSIILKNAHIGSNCVVAAGSVVNVDIPDNALFVQKKDCTIKIITSNE
jgi:acetyltransferase-like isoleucine patch superfamily enzyme